MGGKGAQKKGGRRMDFTGWEFLFIFGRSLGVYGKGDDRVMVNEENKVVVSWRMQ